jgi:hypothetical protein
LFPATFSLLCKELNLSSGWLSERRKLGLLLGVTSLIIGESRVTNFNPFDITAECDTTVIRDEMP